MLEQPQRRLRKAHIARLDDLDQQDRQHVGHRVVTPALEFEQRAQVLFQAQPRDRRIEKTDAESVEDITEASSSDSVNVRLGTPVSMPEMQ